MLRLEFGGLPKGRKMLKRRVLELFWLALSVFLPLFGGVCWGGLWELLVGVVCEGSLLGLFVGVVCWGCLFGVVCWGCLFGLFVGVVWWGCLLGLFVGVVCLGLFLGVVCWVLCWGCLSGLFVGANQKINRLKPNRGRRQGPPCGMCRYQGDLGGSGLAEMRPPSKACYNGCCYFAPSAPLARQKCNRSHALGFGLQPFSRSRLLFFPMLY
jgi:hypothetical protein